MLRPTLAAAALAAMTTGAIAQDDVTTIEFAYPYSHIFDVTYEAILPKFKEEHPNIDVKFRATYESYEDATNTVLREAVSGDLPDVTMQGLNRQRILVDKGIARSLEPFIAEEDDFAKEGYHQAMLDLGTFGGEVYGLPFSVSLPIGYYNMDLLERAGIKSLPQTWEEVVAACRALDEAGVRTPMWWGWTITGNWFFQSLMWSQGAPTVEGAELNLDGPEAKTALDTMKMLFRECDMPNLSPDEAFASFSAGELPMVFWSISRLGAVERTAGDFDLVTGGFPGIGGAPQGLPAGGNAAMMVSQSEDPAVREAAWKWIKFITSGEGAAEVAKTTGYMPPNKAANELILSDFYERNPNKRAAVDQLGLLREWQAYPGDNGLAITQVIYDGIERLVIGDAEDTAELQEELVEETGDLLPRD